MGTEAQGTCQRSFTESKSQRYWNGSTSRQHVKDRLLKANHNLRVYTFDDLRHVKDRLLKANHNSLAETINVSLHVKDRLLKANHNRKTSGITK